MSDRKIYVYVEFAGTPHLVGQLWARTSRGKEGASFQYEPQWLTQEERFALEPALALGDGTFHTEADLTMFGALGDSAPDRWGRMLMRRAASRRARIANKQLPTLTEIDYLLGVHDEARQGALRFAEQLGGPFLQPSDSTAIPPLVALPKLLAATEHVLSDHESDEDLRLLLAPGSSLGGARPKASVRDHHTLAIAKFPRKDDEYATVLWEAVALTLAVQSGLQVPSWRLQTVARKPVLILQRFDRERGLRIPFLSAMSMLGARDTEQHSYLEIADAIRQHGAAPEGDLVELWRRMVFSILISNTDDHLRNHGFLYEPRQGWKLSPAYDMNPTPTDIKPRVLATAITRDDSTASLDLAFSVAPVFSLSHNAARAIAKEVGNAVATWKKVARHLHISSVEIDRMASAFDHSDLRVALKS